ncbi:NADH:flavin oxidoreductase [Pseudomonas sp. AMR01]|uniref:NADH:flavin oxidoreductase n=1 Tax=Pseudomonas sp. AMR01 TaxID=3064904 RepID=UPI0035BF1EE6
MSPSNSSIVTPFDMGSLKLKNRMALAPMTRVSASESGSATPAMARYYERFAQGGFGLVITEGIYTDRLYSQGYPFQPGITDQEQALAWRVVVDAVHQHEGAAIAQIMHAGALSQANRFVDHSAGPSAIRPKGEQMKFYYGEGVYQVPREMTDEDIADAIDGFAQAAQRAVAIAGFDGVEIHGANGYLLDQFITDYSNQRSDRWGGSVRQRLGLMLEVVGAVKKVVGHSPVGVRISQGKVNDFTHKWPGGEHDAQTIFGSLSEAGVDFIHVTEHEAWQPAFVGDASSLVMLARRYAPNVTLIANGGVQTLQDAERAMQGGADIVAVGKAALANPDWLQRSLESRALQAFDPSLLAPIAHIKDSELK